jgi:hypothetical protein
VVSPAEPMEIGGFDLNILCRWPLPSLPLPSIPSSPHLPSLSTASPSPLDQTVAARIHLQLRHNQQILIPRNENLYFIPSFANKLSIEVLDLTAVYSPDHAPPIEFKQVITLQRSSSTSSPTIQNFQLQKKDLILNVEIQSSWTTLEVFDLKKSLKQSSEVSLWTHFFTLTQFVL